MQRLKTGKTINDHTTGRGIDCFSIGADKANALDLSLASLANNRIALNLLLESLNTLDESVLPDLIVFDDRLKEEFGIVSGHDEFGPNNKGANGIIQKKYKNLKKIDFGADSGHQNHIHIAFSPQRAGNYLDYTIADPGSAWGPTTPEGTPGSPEQLIFEPELYESTIDKPDQKMKNLDALYRALIQLGGYKPENAAIFMAIAERESGGFSSAGFNGNLNSGDYSLGLWQINFAPGANEKLLDVTMDFPLLSNGKITTKKAKLLHLVFKDHKELFKDNEKLKLTKIQMATQLMKTIYKDEGERAGRKYADPLVFTPAVQIEILKKFNANYTAKNNWKYTAWGEYSGGPEYGWITALKFKTAVGFYVKNNPGKTEEDLKNFCKGWIGNMLDSHDGKSVYSRWLNGEVFQ